MEKLNITVYPHGTARSADFNRTTGKIDEIVDWLNALAADLSTRFSGIDVDLSSLDESVKAIKKVLNGDSTQTDALLRAGVITYLRNLAILVADNADEIMALDAWTVTIRKDIKSLEESIAKKADVSLIEGVRSDLNTKVDEVQNSLDAEIGQVRNDLDTKTGQLKDDIKRLSDIVSQFSYDEYESQKEIIAASLNDLNTRLLDAVKKGVHNRSVASCNGLSFSVKPNSVPLEGVGIDLYYGDSIKVSSTNTDIKAISIYDAEDNSVIAEGLELGEVFDLEDDYKKIKISVVLPTGGFIPITVPVCLYITNDFITEADIDEIFKKL